MADLDYRKMAQQALDLATGGAGNMINQFAHAYSGDLLFPVQRTTRYKDFMRQQQQQGGVDPYVQENDQFARQMALQRLRQGLQQQQFSRSTER
jgi:hypothetical protein